MGRRVNAGSCEEVAQLLRGFHVKDRMLLDGGPNDKKGAMRFRGYLTGNWRGWPPGCNVFCRSAAKGGTWPATGCEAEEDNADGATMYNANLDASAASSDASQIAREIAGMLAVCEETTHDNIQDRMRRRSAWVSPDGVTDWPGNRKNDICFGYINKSTNFSPHFIHQAIDGDSGTFWNNAGCYVESKHWFVLKMRHPEIPITKVGTASYGNGGHDMRTYQVKRCSGPSRDSCDRLIQECKPDCGTDALQVCEFDKPEENVGYVGLFWTGWTQKCSFEGGLGYDIAGVWQIYLREVQFWLPEEQLQRLALDGRISKAAHGVGVLEEKLKSDR